MIRVAVVGVGGMGRCHARHLAELAGVEVGWVADPDERAGTSLAAEVGATWSADGLDSIEHADAVVVASPDRFHFDHVRAAVERGIPVLCEKPLTQDLADAEALVNLEVARGARLIQVGFMREYDEPHVQVREALKGLGPVHHLRCVHRNTSGPYRPLDRVLGQSVVHDIHSIRFLTGTEITSVATAAVEREEGLRFVLLTCRLDNGAVATIEFDDGAAGYEVSVEVDAEKGNVTSAPPQRALVRADGVVGSTIGDDWFAPFLDTYRIEIRAWLDGVKQGVAVGPSAWDGYVAQAVVAAAVRSSHSGSAETVTLLARAGIYERQWS